MRKIKEEKGSITLYVIVSMIFFLIVVVAIYVSSTNKKIIQEKQIEDIQKSYQTEDINAIYDEAHYSDTKYLEVQTLEELQKALDDEDAKYIKLTANIITTPIHKIIAPIGLSNFASGTASIAPNAPPPPEVGPVIYASLTISDISLSIINNSFALIWQTLIRTAMLIKNIAYCINFDVKYSLSSQATLILTANIPIGNIYFIIPIIPPNISFNLIPIIPDFP